MSWDDPFDDERKRLRRWLGDFLPPEILSQLEEMVERMMEEMSEGQFFDHESIGNFLKDPKGTNPFVFGFSMRVGPDGKPILQRFGNTPAVSDEGPRISPHLEPLVDIIEENDEVIVVAELPGVEKDEINVRVKGQHLTIHVDNPERPYHKELELPSKVQKEDSKSSIRNGVLEVRLKRA